MPLDRTIQELESQLPDLRHLIAEGEVVIATSESAALLANELEFLLSRAGDIAHRLRHLLLGGSLSDVLASTSAAPPSEPPEATATADAPPVDATPETDTNAWTNMDEELARILGVSVEDSLSEASGTQSEQEPEEPRLGDAPPRPEHIEEVEAMARHLLGDQERISALFHELGLPSPRTGNMHILFSDTDILPGEEDNRDTPGGAAVGARLNPPPPPRRPGAERTVADAEQPPRDP